ncbi:MAG: hypothetical protein OER88_00355 [Planctomycetota bacterium]|nr:hypothetical protein [Planctomycetota bacterium]
MPTLLALAPWWIALWVIRAGFLIVPAAAVAWAPAVVAGAQCVALFVIAAGRPRGPDVARVFD